MQLRSFPRTLVVLILSIAVVNAFAHYHFWYWSMRWFDMPMHFAGGMWLAGVAIWWHFFSGKFPDARDRLPYLLMWGVGSAFIVGLVWEAYEAVVALATKGYINAMSDTLSDLFLDVIGGLAVVVIVWLRRDKFIK